MLPTPFRCGAQLKEESAEKGQGLLSVRRTGETCGLFTEKRTLLSMAISEYLLPRSAGRAEADQLVSESDAIHLDLGPPKQE
jgi:hypothetical protein